jgi:hypothetical protein
MHRHFKTPVIRVICHLSEEGVGLSMPSGLTILQAAWLSLAFVLIVIAVNI